MKWFCAFWLVLCGMGTMGFAETLHKEMVELNSENFDAVMRTEGSLVIDVYTPWCGPCRSFAPIFHELHQAFGEKTQFAKLNAQDQGGLAQSFQVQYFPTFIFIKNGKEVGRRSGYLNKQQFIDEMERQFQ